MIARSNHASKQATWPPLMQTGLVVYALGAEEPLLLILYPSAGMVALPTELAACADRLVQNRSYFQNVIISRSSLFSSRREGGHPPSGTTIPKKHTGEDQDISLLLPVSLRVTNGVSTVAQQ
jgi:hypothetical protein